MTAKSESLLLNVPNTVHWRDRWWLLDVETSGIHPQEDEIIALYMAHMENFAVDEERTILIRPQKLLDHRAECLTGISNRDLEQGIPLEDAMQQLKELEGENFLIFDRNFDLPFLKRACAQCRIEYQLSGLLLDRLAEFLLRGTDHRRVSLLPRNLLEKLPPPPGDWPNTPPDNRSLKELYRLALALFGRLAVERDIHDTAQLVQLIESEE